MGRSIRVNSHGRVTIPAALRRRAGLLPGTEVELILQGETVAVVRTDAAEAERRRALDETLSALPSEEND